MRTIQCQHCEVKYSAQTQDEVLNQFYAHYMQEHKAVITGVDEAGKKVWMDTFSTRWSEAPETH